MMDFINAIPHINKYSYSKRKRSLYHIGHTSHKRRSLQLQAIFYLKFIYSNSFPNVRVCLCINKMVELLKIKGKIYNLNLNKGKGYEAK